MLEGGGAKVLPVIPQLIIPLKSECAWSVSMTLCMCAFRD